MNEEANDRKLRKDAEPEAVAVSDHRANIEQINPQPMGATQPKENEFGFLASLLDSFSEAVICVDIHRTITSWNCSAEKVYRFQPAEVIGKPFSLLVLPADFNRSLDTLLQVPKRQPGQTSETVYFEHKGNESSLYVAASALRNKAGDLLGVSFIARDTTERRAVDSSSQEASEWLRMIIETATEYAIFSLGLDRRIMTWNSGAQALLGYTAAEAIGKKGDIIFTEEDRALGKPEEEAATASSTGRASDERWHLRKDGSKFWASGVMMAMRDSAGRVVGLVKIFRDMTAQLEATARIEQSREELWSALQETEKARADVEAAVKAKDHFLAIVSHELRTPLTPVLMTVDSLLRRTDLPDRVQEGIQLIKRNVEIESRFIDDLLDVTRINRHKFEIVTKPVNLHDVVRAASTVVVPDINAKDQELSMSLEATSHNMDGDFTRLQQVIWNLLKNASKFTPKKGCIRIHTRNVRDRFQLVVSDNGVGIPAEALPTIFDAFDQGSEGTSLTFGGLGLGLAISKATIESHGGTIRAESEGANCGSTFIVELPLSAA